MVLFLVYMFINWIIVYILLCDLPFPLNGDVMDLFVPVHVDLFTLSFNKYLLSTTVDFIF